MGAGLTWGQGMGRERREGLGQPSGGSKMGGVSPEVWGQRKGDGLGAREPVGPLGI